MTSNDAPSIASSASRSRTASASFGPASARASCSAAARPASAARASLEPRPAVLERLLGALELLAAARALGRVGEHRLDRAAVLALQPVELRQALLDLVEAARRGVDALAVAAQLAGEVVGLDGEAVGPGGEAVQRGVDALQRGEGRGGRREGGRGAAG